MNITIDGRKYTYKWNGEDVDIKKMYIEELKDMLKDVINEREGCREMSRRGLILDEVYIAVENEIAERKNRPQLKNNFLCEIIDNVDEWLEDKGVRIPNEERDEEDPDNATNFYGDDFDWFMNMMREVCCKYEIIVEDEWDDTREDVSKIKATCLNCGNEVVGDVKHDILGSYIICSECGSSFDVE